MAVPSPVPIQGAAIAVSNEGFETFTVTALSGTSATACYTADSATQRRITKIKKLVIHNTTAGALNVTVAYYKASATTAYEWYGATSLGADTQLVFNEIEWLMESADELRVTGNTGINVFVSAREFHGNVK